MTTLWEPVRQGPAISIRPSRSKPIDSDWQNAVILPDMQIGWFKNREQQLEPIHDEQAIAIALEIIIDAKPKQIVLLGDNLDLPDFSTKYRKTPAFQQTTQQAIDRATTLCATIRANAPHAQIVWIAGNHEERLQNYIVDNALAAHGIRQGNASQYEYPVLSVPFLCRLGDSQVEYISGYPGGSHWITPRLRAIHGHFAVSGGSTAHKYLNTEKTSVVYGHVHRREWAERSRDDFDGTKTILAASPGCLARVDGVVPSVKQALDYDGRPLRRVEDWQQGVAVVNYSEDTGEFVYEQIAIHSGRAMWRGKWYYGENGRPTAD